MEDTNAALQDLKLPTLTSTNFLALARTIIDEYSTTKNLKIPIIDHLLDVSKYGTDVRGWKLASTPTTIPQEKQIELLTFLISELQGSRIMTRLGLASCTIPSSSSSSSSTSNPLTTVNQTPLSSYLTISEKTLLTESSSFLSADFQMRRTMLLKRIDVTSTAFLWSTAVKGSEDAFKLKIAELRSKLTLDVPNFELDKLDDLCTLDIINSFLAPSQNTDEVVGTLAKSVLIGVVPDRGGRPDEKRMVDEKKSTMPDWKAREGGDDKGGSGKGWNKNSNNNSNKKNGNNNNNNNGSNSKKNQAKNNNRNVEKANEKKQADSSADSTPAPSSIGDDGEGRAKKVVAPPGDGEGRKNKKAAATVPHEDGEGRANKKVNSTVISAAPPAALGDGEGHANKKNVVPAAAPPPPPSGDGESRKNKKSTSTIPSPSSKPSNDNSKTGNVNNNKKRPRKTSNDTKELSSPPQAKR